MFEFAFAFILITSLAIFAFVFYTFFKQRRTIGKIFDVAERELDHRLNKHQKNTPRLVECGHCGSQVTAGEDCPKCGAPT